MLKSYGAEKLSLYQICQEISREEKILYIHQQHDKFLYLQNVVNVMEVWQKVKNDLYAKHLIKLKRHEILSIFGEEAKKLIRLKLREYNNSEDIKIFKEYIFKLKHKGFHPSEENILLDISFMLLPGDTKKKIQRIEELKAMQRLMSRPYTEGEITDGMIAIAKDVKIYDLIPMQQKGRKYWASCPLPSHIGGDSTPSLVVSQNKFRCFGCGRYGDSIQFVQDWKNMKFAEAVKWLNSGFQKQNVNC